MDVPNPIPASLQDLDLSYAIDTFQIGTYRMEDLPQTFPVFNKRTGRITRYAKGKRVSSMPILSHKSKDLPMLPPKSDGKSGMKHLIQRSVSVLPQNNFLKDFLRTDSLESNVIDDKQMASATAKNTSIAEETDNVFSQSSIFGSVSASSVSSDEYTQMSASSRKSIFEVNGGFIYDSSSSTYSEIEDIEDDTLDNIYAIEMCLEEPELGSIFDQLSSGDSLWDSDKESIKDQQVAAAGNYASTSILEYYNGTSDDQNEVLTAAGRDNLPPIGTEKDLPSLPRSLDDRVLVLPKVRNNKILRPVSMFSMTNQSCFSTLTGSKSLRESKQDMKLAINGSIDVCLDSGKDYGYSRYYSSGRTKPRATSAALASPLQSCSLNTSTNIIKPKVSFTHLTNATQYNDINTIPHIEETTAAASHKPKAGRSVSAFLASTFKAFSSDLSTIMKKQ